MSKVPSIFNEGQPNALNQDNAQVRWCLERCKKCHSLVTLQVLANDIPCFLKCMVCDEQHIYSEEDLKEMNLL